VVQSGKVIDTDNQQQVPCYIVQLSISHSLYGRTLERRDFQAAFRIQSKVSREVIDMDCIFG
jgi:hypothetical protein